MPLRVLVVLGLALMGACGGEEAHDEGEARTPTAPASGSPAIDGPSPTPTEPGELLDTPASDVPASDTPAPPDACARAEACCPAYVAALPASGRAEADQACSTLSLAMELEGRPRDEACQGALEGFQASLRATGLDVPPACR